MKNLLARAEYTKIMPWVYSNFVQTQTYTNSNSVMGHYIGQNADQLYGELDYSIFGNCSVKLWGEAIRRGGFADVALQYQKPGKAFLYGPIRRERNFGVEADAEFLHELFLKVWFTFSDISDEDANRTPFELGKTQAFGITARYGW